MWVVQITNPEEINVNRPGERTWRNRGIGILSKTLEGAVQRTREEFPECKILSVNKHCNQVYVEKCLESDK